MEIIEIYKKIIDNAIEMLVIHDEEGKVVMFNESAACELGVEDLTGVDINRICPQGAVSGDETVSTQRVYDGKVREMMVYRKNLTCFRALVKAYTTECPQLPYVVMIRNISGQYALEKTVEFAKEEALATARTKSEFTANVTHELRTPVNGILGNTNMLIEQEQDADKLKLLNTIKRSCQDMNELINSVLDFSKLEAGKFTLENREFDFRQMIDDIRNIHMPEITEKGLNYYVNVSPDIPEKVIGDELRIKQIINNLLSNACKFTHVGKISLECLVTAREKNRIELFCMVVDTGIGIDAADMDKLFKSYSQVDASVSRKYGGTGLGLNIAKQLVELMGGNISVDSEKNKGTMFSFSIWLEISEESKTGITTFIAERHVENFREFLGEDSTSEKLHTYGSPENKRKIEIILNKLVLCLEMDNWEKAEDFGETIRELTATAPKEIKTMALKLKLAIQKEDYAKSIEAYNSFKEKTGQ